MFSPLRTRYLLLQEFPELVDAKFYNLSVFEIGILLIFPDGKMVSDDRPKKWIEQAREISTEYLIVNDCLERIEGKTDLLTEAAELGVDVGYLTDQRVNQDGVIHYLEHHFKDAHIELLSIYDGPGSISVFIEDQFLNPDQKVRIEKLLKLLFCHNIGIHIRPLSQFPSQIHRRD